MKAVRVLVADPTDGGAERISKVLTENPRIEVVATARTGAETIRKTSLSKPHVVTMDIQFMDMNAAQVITTLSSLDQRVSVYLLGPHVTPENPLLKGALAAGAFDYIRCSRTESDLATYQRQIVTTIFAAGLTSSKMIPHKEGRSHAEGLDGMLRGKRLVVIAWSGDRLRELTGFFTGSKVGRECEVLLFVDVPPNKVPQVLADLTEVAGRHVQGLVRGAEISGGHLWVTGRRKADLTIGPGPAGKDAFIFTERANGDERGPSLDGLFKSMAAYYHDSTAAILVGGDGSEGLYGLKAIQDEGGGTLVDDQSIKLLESIKKWLPNARIPRAVASQDNLRVLLRELA